MHPILFKIPIFGGISIHTYGVLVALGFLAGIIWIMYETRRLRLDSQSALDLIFFIILSAILGSRIYYLAVNEPARIVKQPWLIFTVWEGGLVFYGGLIAAILVSIWYVRRRRMSLSVYADVFAPAVALGHAFGRMGCFMAGCCYGAPAGASFFGIVFPSNPDTIAPAGVPLYPTQIIESLGELAIFLGLVVFRRHKKFEGEVFAIYLIAYPVLRFFAEMLRADLERGFIIPGVLSSAQGVSIALFIIGIVVIVRGYRRERLTSMSSQRKRESSVIK